jgi:hypothetical protein
VRGITQEHNTPFMPRIQFGAIIQAKLLEERWRVRVPLLDKANVMCELTFTTFSAVSINLDAPNPHCAIGVLFIVSTSC